MTDESPNGKFVYLTGNQGKAVIKVVSGEIVDGGGEKRFLIVDKANVILGDFKVPSAVLMKQVYIGESFGESFVEAYKQYLDAIQAELSYYKSRVADFERKIEVAHETMRNYVEETYHNVGRDQNSKHG